MICTDYNIIKGLSDAEIIEIKETTYQYNYKQRNPIRNSLQIIFDSKSAMVSTNVKSIIFYNYKIICENSSFVHSWWFDSDFIDINGKKGLKISFRHSKSVISETIILFDELKIVQE